MLLKNITFKSIGDPSDESRDDVAEAGDEGCRPDHEGDELRVRAPGPQPLVDEQPVLQELADGDVPRAVPIEIIP